MLQVRETHVEQARLPVKDIHTYISFSAKSANGVELVLQRQYQGTPEELLAVMDRKSIRSMVNLIGGALVSPDSRNCSFIIPNVQHNLTIRPEDKGPFFWWKTAPGVYALEIDWMRSVTQRGSWA